MQFFVNPHRVLYCVLYIDDEARGSLYNVNLKSAMPQLPLFMLCIFLFKRCFAASSGVNKKCKICQKR